MCRSSGLPSFPSLGRLRGSTWWRPVVASAGAAAAAGSGAVVLLRRMRADFHCQGRLRRSTAAVMYSAYAAHMLATVAAWTRKDLTVVPDLCQLGTRPARTESRAVAGWARGATRCGIALW